MRKMTAVLACEGKNCVLGKFFDNGPVLANK
jgi:hypothetical protein